MGCLDSETIDLVLGYCMFREINLLEGERAEEEEVIFSVSEQPPKLGEGDLSSTEVRQVIFFFRQFKYRVKLFVLSP